jgi:hypothetical protein
VEKMHRIEKRMMKMKVGEMITYDAGRSSKKSGKLFHITRIE